MDYSSIDSEFIESLDFLRPPVKRNFRTIARATSAHIGERNISIQAFDEFCKKVSAETQHPQIIDSSSSSVILNKTDDKIIKQYSVLSYKNFVYSNPAPKTNRVDPPAPKEKPLIRVTVFPKSTQTKQTLRNRKNTAKRVQTTVSNQENSVSSRNIFLVVPSGNKKDKVYQIKNSGSANFTNSLNDFKDEVIPIDQLSSLKLVLDSLNMERKKEKSKKKRKKSPTASMNPDFSRKNCENDKTCDCTCYRHCVDNVDVSDRKSFVRITGQLGMSEDDRYILSCAATVNDKPVVTSFTEAQKVSPSPSPRREDRRFFNISNVDTCPTRCYENAATSTFSVKKDFNMQTDIQQENRIDPQVVVNTTNVMRSKETQATQDDFAIGTSTETEKNNNIFQCKDEFIQCCCTNVKKTNWSLGHKEEIVQRCMNIEQFKNPLRCRDEVVQCRCENFDRENLSDSESDSNSVKECQSPLVIISVYPASDCTDNGMESHLKDNQYFLPQKTIVCNQNVKQRPYSESKEKRNEKKANGPIKRLASPDRMLNKMSNKTNSPTNMLRTRKISPERETNNKQTKPTRERNLSKPLLNNNRVGLRDRSPQRSANKVTKGTNTEHNMTKKTLVENYTKQLTAFMDSIDVENKKELLINHPSKIVVNINGDTERYDVLFQQDDVATDLKVKKTVKGTQNRNHKDSTSKRKVLTNSDEPVRGPQAVCMDEQVNDEPPFNTFSRLHLRDSLEISHRHDVKAGKKGKGNTFNTNDDSSLFSAPIKHYTGDNCPIANPIQRDKEIRSLLGVDKGVTAAINQGTKPAKTKHPVPVHYYYNKTCEKKIVTGINLMEVPPPCVCCDVRKKYYPTPTSYPSNQVVPPAHSLSRQQQMRNPQMPQSQHSQMLNEQQMRNSQMQQSQHSQMNQMLNQQNQLLSQHSEQLKQILSRHSQQLIAQQKKKSNQQMQASRSRHETPLNEENQEETTTSEEDDVVVPTKSQSHKSRYRSNSTGTQYETQVRRTSLYQQLILNRNIQVFLQVEQFSKQKPIVLTRKQYDKVKRTIENTISNKTREKKKCICKTSLVSVGNVRVKPRYRQTLNYNGQSQTAKNDLIIRKKSSSNSNKSVRIVGRACVYPQDKASRPTYVLFSKEGKARTNMADKELTPVTPRQTVSSIELRYASMSYMKHVTFSSTNVEVGSTKAPLQQKESHSVHTIFKGHRRCHTPNLGTSMFSLFSEEEKPRLLPEAPKKKPFLRRLMSCLVMRSARASVLDNAPEAPKPATVESSVDSYHISTSLGAIEVTSSIYDTSASFYTNHSVYPIRSKMKRGFFSSVREFLGNRKS